METKVESRVGKMPVNADALYRLFSDFRNLTQLIPKDKLRNFEAAEDTCSFEADMVGQVGLKIIEKQPYSLVKIVSSEISKFSFTFWIQLKEVAAMDTRIKLTLAFDANPFMAAMVKGQVEKALNSMIDRMEQQNFSYN
jgi:carbon monoxide dehydrogenase subunit G